MPGPSSPLVRHFASSECCARDAHSARAVERRSHTCDDVFHARHHPQCAPKNHPAASSVQKKREKWRKIGRNTLFDLDEWLLFIE
jgi:hypothetical protein